MTSKPIEIISKSAAGREVVDWFSGEEIPPGQNVENFIVETEEALKNYECFENADDFFEVFTRAIDLVNKYNATPSTLHLYLNGLTVESSGKKSDDSQLEFLYLQVMRWFHHYGMMPQERVCGVHREPDWGEDLDGCLPCACDHRAASCECENEYENRSCGCHWHPRRNLYRLIHPITESGDFDYLKRRLELLPNNQERLKLLVLEKTEYDQMFGEGGGSVDAITGIVDVGFSKKCDLEISKYKQLAELERESNAKRDRMLDKVSSKSLSELRTDRELSSNISSLAAAMRRQEYPANSPGIEPISQFPEDAAEPVEGDAPIKFTRKQVMALLDAFAPEFKNADNVAKAAFIVKLTPYIGERNIAQEYSYLRHNDYDELVGDWSEKFRKSGRGRKKKTT